MENEIIEVKADIVPDFAISLKEAETRLEQFKKFIASQMIERIDYGKIPGIPKPSLFKPGAEKLCNIFGFAPHFDIVDQIKDWQRGFFHYQIKCRLISKRSGNIIAEGVGSCNSKEKRYRNQDAFTLDNTILKMAKKRAHVDATLTATRASGEFTQDIEDIENEEKELATEKQLNLLKKMKIDYEENITKDEASKLIAEKINEDKKPKATPVKSELSQLFSHASKFSPYQLKQLMVFNKEFNEDEWRQGFDLAGFANEVEVKTGADAGRLINVFNKIVKGD